MKKITLTLFILLLLAGCQSESDGFIVLPKAANLIFGKEITVANLSTGENVGDWKKHEQFNLGDRIPYGSVRYKEVIFKNQGALPAHVLNAWVEAADPSVFDITNNCNSKVLPGETCAIVLKYKPNTIGDYKAILHMGYNNGYTKKARTSVSLKAFTTTDAFLSFERDLIDFGNTTINYFEVITVKVLYNGMPFVTQGKEFGKASLVLFSNPANGFELVRDSLYTCGQIVDRDCQIRVKFTPASLETKKSFVSLTYTNAYEALSTEVNLKAAGLPAKTLASLTATPAELAFGPVVVNPVNAVEKFIQINFPDDGSVPADNVVIDGPANKAVFSINSTTSECRSTINSSCKIYVSFKPNAKADFTDNITIKYSTGGITKTPLVINITGKGADPALLRFGPTPSKSFGNISAFKLSEVQKFTVENIGGVAVLSFAPIVSSNSSFVASYNSCANLAPAATCSVDVTFTPQQAGLLNSTFSSSYNNGRAQVPVTNLTASGAGTSALDIVAGATSINFGYVIIGSNPAPIAGVLNLYGTTTAAVLQPSPALPSPFQFGASTCNAGITPSASVRNCTFQVNVPSTNFSAGPYTATSTYTYNGTGNNGSGTIPVAVNMNLQPRPDATLSSAIPFSPTSVNHTQRATFQVKNESSYFYTIGGAPSLSGSDNNAFKVSGCEGSLAPQNTCTINVDFTPTSEKTFNATLNYSFSNQIQTVTKSMALSASGSNSITLVPNQTALNFSTIYLGDTSAPQYITLKYYGNTNGWSRSITDAGPYLVELMNCGVIGDCTLKVQYRPTSSGPQSQPVTFNYGSGLSGSQFQFTFHGSGQDKAASLSLSNNTFPKTLQNTSRSQSLTISNTGNSGATLSIASSSAAFSISSWDSCGGSTKYLGGGTSCSITVSFSPGAPISYSTPLVTSGPTQLSIQGQGTQPIKLFAGAYKTCILNELGSPVCWGSGQGPTPVNFPAGVVIKQISVGGTHTCAVSTSGNLYCWGGNSYGQLGLGNNTPMNSPSDLGLNGVTMVASGSEHTCAIVSGGVKCWGKNTEGQLGVNNSDSISRATNAAVVYLGGAATSVSAGVGHSCAVYGNSDVKCWGNNNLGQLGQGSEDLNMGNKPNDMNSMQPIAIKTSGFTPESVQASPGGFTCVLSSEGDVKCFGKAAVLNNNVMVFPGVLGLCWQRQYENTAATVCNNSQSPTDAIGYLPTDLANYPIVSLGTSANQLAAGASFGCVLTQDDAVKCWGYNTSGQLGIGNNENIGVDQSKMGTNMTAALSGSGADEAIDIGSGNEHACAVLKNNTVKCWGSGTENASGTNQNKVSPLEVYNGN